MKLFFLLLILLIIVGLITTRGWLPGKRFNITKTDEKLAQRLKSHVYILAHEIGNRSVFSAYDNLNKTANYIIKTFRAYGYKVKLQEFNYKDKLVKNIIATKLGNKKVNEVIIVGAHYDSCFNPGADDNASGIAGLLELAKLMAARPSARTIKFIAFTNEEPPLFKTENMGSRVYVRHTKAAKENIKAAVILEMIGYYRQQRHSQKYPPFFGLFYPNVGNFIAVVGNFKSRSLVKQLTASFKKHSSFPIESISTFGFIQGVDWSDHWSFWKEGYKAVMITDTGFYRNPNYHKHTDTYDTLDYASMAAVINSLKYSLINLGD